MLRLHPLAHLIYDIVAFSFMRQLTAKSALRSSCYGCPVCHTLPLECPDLALILRILGSLRTCM